MNSDPLIFFGTDVFSLPSLNRLIAEDRRIIAVVTKPDTTTGRGRQLTAPPIKQAAEAANIPVLQPTRLKDIEDTIERLHPAAGIVVAYGKIIPQSTIDRFPKGLINVHASLLPRWRGASPIEHAILAGDEDTGVTLMQIEAGLDTGPTYTASKLQLTGQETRPALYEELAEMGADLLSADLDAILSGTITALPQDNAIATTAGMIRKSDGNIDWKQPAAAIERQIRAYLGWPGSRAVIAGKDVIITSAHILDANGPAGTAYRTASKELAVYCGAGSLIINTLKPAGKAEMSGPAFLAGNPL